MLRIAWYCVTYLPAPLMLCRRWRIGLRIALWPTAKTQSANNIKPGVPPLNASALSQRGWTREGKVTVGKQREAAFFAA